MIWILAGNVTQNDIAAQVSPGVINGFKVIATDQGQRERLMGVQQFIHIVVRKRGGLQPVNASWVA